MAVFRVEKNKGYTVMSNHHLRNKELSLKAKGLLSQMLSLPEDWDYTLAGLSLINREKIDAIREAVRELENAGYIQRSRERDLFFVYLFDKVGQAVCLAPGADLSGKVLSLGEGFSMAFATPLPSLAPMDLLIGIFGAVLIRLIVYVKGKNAKKYRKGVEYGSARWGNAEDIKPYTDPVFQNNVLLTQTERLTMNSRPKQPKYASLAKGYVLPIGAALLYLVPVVLIPSGIMGLHPLASVMGIYPYISSDAAEMVKKWAGGIEITISPNICLISLLVIGSISAIVSVLALRKQTY